ncbi:Phosphatidylethanolamine-binding protein [Clostridium cavendishii DSM 21758]|uniref:Phosphatidylethanolamine-binding protein n=1 Tax=Clostridium cavendishii DSM 21758 TaxID=1121302 RepID=A0A1M6SER7_9CLOT|nr:Phosphatidylethanolamine-binding protein [Clostridium cavendishii DSM 21758]
MSKEFLKKLPKAVSFEVTSKDIIDEKTFALEHFSGIFGVEDGQDASPHLSWSGAPEGTKSYAVTIYDIDAQTGSGLPQGAFPLPNDASVTRFI